MFFDFGSIGALVSELGLFYYSLVWFGIIDLPCGLWFVVCGQQVSCGLWLTIIDLPCGLWFVVCGLWSTGVLWFVVNRCHQLGESGG